MPAFPPGTITADLCIKTLFGTRKSRTYWVSDEVPESVKDVEAIANGIKTVFAAQLTALMPTTYTFDRVEARYRSGAVDLEAPSNTPAVAGGLTVTPGSGSLTPESGMPDEACLVLRISTGKGGRSKRGRRFISGLHERVNADGEIEPVMRPLCIALATKFPQDITEVSLPDNGNPTILHARHYDRKNNVLEPITKCWALDAIGTRKDRRKPIRFEPLTIGA